MTAGRSRWRAAARGSQASTSTGVKVACRACQSPGPPPASTTDIRYELVRRRDREDHDQPPGGAQRVPPADARRASRRLRARARGRPDGRRDRPHRRGRHGVLLRRRPARPRRRRLHRRRRRRPQGIGRSTSLDLQIQIRRLPKPVVAMVAGYAIGGGHVLHVVLRPDDRRRQRALRPDRPEGRLVRRRLRRPACSPARSARSARRRSGSCAASTTREQALDMGLVNTVVPLERPRGGDRRSGAARCSRSRRFALRLLKASLQRRRGRPGGHPAARRRRQPALLHERGGPGGPRRLHREAPARLLAVPAAAVAGRDEVARVRIWLMAARPRTLPAAIAPVLVGTALAATRGRPARRRVHRRAARRALHPGRHEPLQRLLRRAPRRRHRGPPRPGARDRRRPRPARARCSSRPT